MGIPTDLAGILSELGLPVGAGALAWGLVKGADAIEADAKEERLKYISGLLKDQSITSFGKLGPSIVPFVFEKTFGSRALSFNFISRSIVASISFWMILLLAKRADVFSALSQTANDKLALETLPVVLFIDWLSLAKAKFLLKMMSERATVIWMALFVIIDVSATLLMLVSILYLFLTLIGANDVNSIWTHTGLVRDIVAATYEYYIMPGIETGVIAVTIPSTMLTSAWVLLFLVSVMLLKLLAPLEYIRYFTLWWFKDIDAHPLRAVAKVAATLIVIGAFALKALRWGWLLV
jgi:hypothetical protein